MVGDTSRAQEEHAELTAQLGAMEGALEAERLGAAEMRSSLYGAVSHALVRKLVDAIAQRLKAAFERWVDNAGSITGGERTARRLAHLRDRAFLRVAMRKLRGHVLSADKGSAVAGLRAALADALARSDRYADELAAVVDGSDWRETVVGQQRALDALRLQLDAAQTALRLEREASVAASPVAHRQHRDRDDRQPLLAPATGSGGGAAAAAPPPKTPAALLHDYAEAKTRESARARREAAECRARLDRSAHAWSALRADRARLAQHGERARLQAARELAQLRDAVRARDGRVAALHRSLLSVVADDDKDPESAKTVRRKRAAEVLRLHCAELLDEAQQARLATAGHAAPPAAVRAVPHDAALLGRVNELSDEVAELRAQGGVLAVLTAQETADALSSELAARARGREARARAEAGGA